MAVVADVRADHVASLLGTLEHQPVRKPRADRVVPDLMEGVGAGEGGGPLAALEARVEKPFRVPRPADGGELHVGDHLRGIPAGLQRAKVEVADVAAAGRG